MSDLIVSFSGYVLSPSWIQVSFRTRRVIWSINNPLGVAFNVFQENPNELVIHKGVIHLGKRFVREA